MPASTQKSGFQKLPGQIHTGMQYLFYRYGRASLMVLVLAALLLQPGFAGRNGLLQAEFKLHNHVYRDGPFTKFSEWIPSRLHDVPPRFVEDFYALFTKPLLYDEMNLRRNIGFLQFAMTRRFRHPSQALCRIQTKG